jgi:SAM-dependent methyltransferase
MQNLKEIVKASQREFGFVKFLDYGSGNSTLSKIIGRSNSRLLAKSFDPFFFEMDLSNRIHTLSTQDFEAYNDINVITMVHVIEHLQNPDEVLSLLHKKLVTGGFLVIITPNVSDLSFKIFREFWCFLHYPYHLTLFGSSSLDKCLVKNNFKLTLNKNIFAGNTFAYSVDNYIKSLSITKRRGHSRIYPLLVLLFAPLEFILWRLGLLRSVQMKVAQKIN